MGNVYLVRHGQASFGADDYDQLSSLGAQQCVRLGRWWRQRRQAFDAVYRGTLKRHQQSLAAIDEGQMEASSAPWQAHAAERVGLNEYDSHALIEALRLPPLPRTTDASVAREHFQQLRQALRAWTAGEIHPQGMPSFAAFQAGVVDVLREAHAASRSGDVLVVSSGGPISVAMAHVLQAPHDTALALNMRLRNSAICQLTTTARGFDMVAFNALPHLEDVPAMVTHA
jgi:broad specificity phosphatase PhoE